MFSTGRQRDGFAFRPSALEVVGHLGEGNCGTVFQVRYSLPDPVSRDAGLRTTDLTYSGGFQELRTQSRHGSLDDGSWPSSGAGGPSTPQRSTSDHYTDPTAPRSRADSDEGEQESSSATNYALKTISKHDVIMKESKIRRVRTEYELLSAVDHPFIVPLHAAFTTPNYLCLLLEYSPVGDFFTVLAYQPMKRLPEQTAKFYVCEILCVLLFLHREGFLYRDLKLENILMRADGHIMLSDFDLGKRVSTNLVASFASEAPSTASMLRQKLSFLDSFMSQTSGSEGGKLKDTSSFASSTTSTGGLPAVGEPGVQDKRDSFVGTPEYMSPEIVCGTGHASEAVDFWSLGVLVYELLYGETPYRGYDDRDTLRRVSQVAGSGSSGLVFPSEPAVSSEAKNLIQQLLHLTPEKRVSSVEELVKHKWLAPFDVAMMRNYTPPELPVPLQRIAAHRQRNMRTSDSDRRYKIVKEAIGDELRLASALSEQSQAPQDPRFDFFRPHLSDEFSSGLKTCNTRPTADISALLASEAVGGGAGPPPPRERSQGGGPTMPRSLARGLQVVTSIPAAAGRVVGSLRDKWASRKKNPGCGSEDR